MFEKVQHVVKLPGLALLSAQGCADGGEAIAVLREDGVFGIQMQRLHEPLAQTGQEVERAAQEHDGARQLPALGQAGDGLIDHGLEDGGSHVFLSSALVQNGLDVALGKDAAAGGDGVDLLVLERQLVQLVHRDVQQGGHLVDEGARCRRRRSRSCALPGRRRRR